MREVLYSPSGFYSPNYLRMKIDTNDSFLDFETLSDIGAATFLHEYVHFLQDITTTYGLFNLCTEVDFIKLFNSKLQKPEVNFIQVPFISTEEDGNTHWNLEMRKIWIGGGEHENYRGEYVVEKESQNIQIGEQIKPLQRIYLQWGNKEDGGVKYYFGSYCISEGMAYEIEQLIYPGVIPQPPQMPYLSTRMVADKIYPNFTKNTENLIALCDACMMYNDPGSLFFETLVKMERTGYYPERPEDIYNYVYDGVIFDYQNINRPLELMYFASHLANTQLSDYFRSNIFEANSIWVARTLAAAENLRTQIPSFILDLARSGDIRKSIIFKAIKNTLGTPVIVNNQNEMFFENVLNSSGYIIKPEYFWVFNEIKDLLTKDWNKRMNLCDLKNFCDKSCDDRGENHFTDHRCYSSPWDRSNDPNPELCVFGATWKTWALQGKELVQSEN
jgi:hypothetical protein